MQDRIPVQHEWVVSTLAWLLASLGITIAPNHFFGGLALSIAFATIVARSTRDQREVWLVILTAVVLSTAVAMAIGYWDFKFHIQLAMGIAGLSSKWAFSIAVKMLNRTEARSDDVADRVLDKVLPKSKGEE